MAAVNSPASEPPPRPRLIFLCQIDKLRERPEYRVDENLHGQHVPPIDPRAFHIVAGDSTGVLLYSDGQRMGVLSRFPNHALPYKTYSVYQHGATFWVLPYDIMNPSGHGTNNEESYHGWGRMGFRYKNSGVSCVTAAPDQFRLCWQRPDQAWPTKLLPEGYQAEGHRRGEDPRFGGLVGELPLLIALIAYSYQESHVVDGMQATILNGDFVTHNFLNYHGRTDGRGMVVRTWWLPQCPPAVLDEIETPDGRFGLIFP